MIFCQNGRHLCQLNRVFRHLSSCWAILYWSREVVTWHTPRVFLPMCGELQYNIINVAIEPRETCTCILSCLAPSECIRRALGARTMHVTTHRHTSVRRNDLQKCFSYEISRPDLLQGWPGPRFFLTEDMAASIARTMVLPRLDYSNSLLLAVCLKYNKTPTHSKYCCPDCFEHITTVPFPAVALAFALATCLFPYQV